MGRLGVEIYMAVYDFRPVTEEDFSLLHRWHNQPWVADNWDGPRTLAQVTTRQREKMSSARDSAFIVCCDGVPVGYIQCGDYFERGDGWWLGESPGTWGIDTYIGEEDFLGKRHGSAYVRQFVDGLCRERGAKKVIVDPHPDNARGIRAYEKAGFRPVKEIDTPDGRALLMEIYREDDR